MIIHLGSEELAQFGGDFGWVHHIEGAEGVDRSRASPIGTGEISCSEFAEWNAGGYECL